MAAPTRRVCECGDFYLDANGWCAACEDWTGPVLDPQLTVPRSCPGIFEIDQPCQLEFGHPGGCHLGPDD